MFEQDLDIVLPLTECGDLHFESVQSVVQVLTELSFRRKVLQILIRGRNDASVNPDAGRSTDTFEHILLQHPQHFRLE